MADGASPISNVETVGSSSLSTNSSVLSGSITAKDETSTGSSSFLQPDKLNTNANNKNNIFNE